MCKHCCAMLTYIVWSVSMSSIFCGPTLTAPIVTDYEYEDSIIIQPIRDSDDLPPALCLLPWPLNTDFGGKIFV